MPAGATRKARGCNPQGVFQMAKCSDCGDLLKWAGEVSIGLCGACGPGSAKDQERQRNDRRRRATGNRGQQSGGMVAAAMGGNAAPGTIPTGITVREDINPDGSVASVYAVGPGINPPPLDGAKDEFDLLVEKVENQQKQIDALTKQVSTLSMPTASAVAASVKVDNGAAKVKE